MQKSGHSPDWEKHFTESNVRDMYEWDETQRNLPKMAKEDFVAMEMEWRRRHREANPKSHQAWFNLCVNHLRGQEAEDHWQQATREIAEETWEEWWGAGTKPVSPEEVARLQEAAKEIDRQRHGSVILQVLPPTAVSGKRTGEKSTTPSNPPSSERK